MESTDSEEGLELTRLNAPQFRVERRLSHVLETSACMNEIDRAAQRYTERCARRELKNPPPLFRVAWLAAIPAVAVMIACYAVTAAPIADGAREFLEHVSAGSLTVAFAREAFSRVQVDTLLHCSATIGGACASLAFFSWSVHRDDGFHIVPFASVYIVDGALIATVVHSTKKRWRDILLSATVALGGVMDALGQMDLVRGEVGTGWHWMPPLFAGCFFFGGGLGYILRYIGQEHLTSFCASFLNISLLASAIELSSPSVGVESFDLQKEGISLPYAVGFIVSWLLIIAGEWAEDAEGL